MDLRIGNAVIPYAVRESLRASCKRIVVTPAGVEVVVPMGTPLEGPDGVAPYVHRKRRWVFDAVREVDAKHRALLDQQYTSGAKLQVRGRWLMLDVQAAKVAAVAVSCRSKFHVVVPCDLQGITKVEAIRNAVEGWLRDRALADLEASGRRHEATLGVVAEGYRLSDAKSRWGSCGRDGVVRVHWRLAQAPTAAFEYVVAHEVAHLLHRNHSAEFWATIGRVLPDWRDRKTALERWEGEHRRP